MGGKSSTVAGAKNVETSENVDQSVESGLQMVVRKEPDNLSTISQYLSDKDLANLSCTSWEMYSSLGGVMEKRERLHKIMLLKRRAEDEKTREENVNAENRFLLRMAQDHQPRMVH